MCPAPVRGVSGVLTTLKFNRATGISLPLTFRLDHGQTGSNPKVRFADHPPATLCDMSNGSCGIGFRLRVQPNCGSVASACIGSPNVHAVSRGEIELVSGPNVECRIPSVEVAHGDWPELVGRVGVGHHLLPEKSFTRL